MMVLASCGQKHNSNFWDSLPDPVGRVNDFEKVYTKSQQSSLDSLVRLIEVQADVEIAIVTLDTSSTAPDRFDDLTLYIAGSWGVGQKEKNNGILIAISKGYRKIRIRNGLGIEKRMTNEETKKIIDQNFIPSFKRGGYYQGMINGLNAILVLLKQHP
jgi:uncharacterized protein